MRWVIGFLIVFSFWSFVGLEQNETQLNFSLMERRDAASFKSWKNVKSGSELHYKKFIRDDSLADPHRHILYEFRFPNLKSSQRYNMEIVSLKGKDTVSVTKGNLKTDDVSPYVFQESMYGIEKQIITLNVGRSSKITFTVFFDIENFVGEG
ncbi:hypothetical protein [Xanthocytophaga agilis]|uniref:Uncharacterized protein n=1 Tax=Xanthocytophaga agilis TaxID=3048010 RepID=A0AAE3R2F3_9BACT|nr:hypothetical protein [Xanthocytophaga agilis]MDJ1499643.1 hypothetical protein [Xanthocytophaga agilis]